MIRSGSLDKRIKLLKQVRQQGPKGAYVETYYPISEAEPASVRFLSGRDASAAGQIQNLFDAIFVVRMRNDLVKKDRVNYNGQDFDIELLAPVSNDRLEISAKAVNS